MVATASRTTVDEALSAENNELRNDNVALRLLVEHLQGALLRAAQDAENLAIEHRADLMTRALALRAEAARAGSIAFAMTPAPARQANGVGA